MRPRPTAIGAALWLAAVTSGIASEQGGLIPPASARYSAAEIKEVPDFQRHVLPLMGRVGCNTRSCHGSFQGAGGFRLSLFGYDFKMDHEALLKADKKRVDVETPELSQILQKPTLGIPHKGGKRFEEEGWEYRLLVRWIEEGAKGAENTVKFERLEVVPNEIVFDGEGKTVPLQVIAHWADGTREDVTCISRYRTNDESIAEIDADGRVTCKGKGDTHVVAFYDNGVAVTQVIRPVSDRIGAAYPDVNAATKVDELVASKLRKLGLVPSEVCTDTEYLRRLSLDLCGSLPTPAEIEAFAADPAPGKRAAKVEEMLSRPAYAAWWTTKLCDMTGNSARNIQMQGFSAPMARDWYRWLYKRVEANMPYDKIVAGIVLATSRKTGQSYDDYVKEQSAYFRQEKPADYTEHETMPYFWLKRGLRTPEEKALGVSYSFLGVRLECAQCHKHPFDQWTQNDFNQFTAFFKGVGYGIGPDPKARQQAREMREALGLDPKKGNVQQQLYRMALDGKVIPWQEVFVVPPGNVVPNQKKNNAQIVKASQTITPRVLGGDTIEMGNYKDPREPLMEWMRKKDNPYFARAFINRVWANDFGSGIVNPPDDMNLANPPSNSALLDYLTEGFIAHEFDMKWLHRELMTSQAYQRSWRPNETNRLDERNFSRAVIRRLPAEVLIDAVAQATAGSDVLAKGGDNLEKRAIGMANGAVARLGLGDYASRVFGASTRETNCDCARSNDPNLLQSIYLQNDFALLNALDKSDSWVAERAKAGAKPAPEGEADDTGLASAAAAEQVVREAFLRTLSRGPSASEEAAARVYLDQAGDEAKGLRDLLWALLNTKEFITNH